MNIHFIKSSGKKEIVAKLEEQFGITNLPYLLIESGKEKIRAFSGSLSKDEIAKLTEIVNIESIGLYVIKQEHDLRLSFDATQILKEQITKNIIDISKEQYEQWINGQDLQIQAQKETLIIQYKDDLLGCGKSTGDKITNHVPKERRLKK